MKCSQTCDASKRITQQHHNRINFNFNLNNMPYQIWLDRVCIFKCSHTAMMSSSSTEWAWRSLKKHKYPVDVIDSSGSVPLCVCVCVCKYEEVRICMRMCVLWMRNMRKHKGIHVTQGNNCNETEIEEVKHFLTETHTHFKCKQLSHETHYITYSSLQ